MKTNIFSKSLFLLLFAVFTTLTSCKKDDVTTEITADEAKKSAQIDLSNDEVDVVIEEAYVNQEGISGKSGSEFPATDCPVRTVVFDGNTRTVTLNFGTGCTRPNGNVLSGIITLVYTHTPGSGTQNMTYTYQNFTFNGIALNGGGTIVRVAQNANNNPQSTATFDVTATFTDGQTAHRTGTRVREWVEGFGNGIWQDNVFKITGNWTTEFSNGNINTGTVTTPLRRVMTCPFIVYGVIQLSHNDFTGTLDFGNGACDNLAVFTGPNGVQHTIVLGN